uniref:BPTI/Kunitz inhibitor domain-containing protein n=1 Tax=Periophthalmus magnuspinnatus TaxID=409849 RepID=A0A3B4BBV8_9GOBI
FWPCGLFVLLSLLLVYLFIFSESESFYCHRCGQSLDPGPCRQYVVRWYYDPEANSCAQFWFGGCQGNANNFESESWCRKTCVST